MNPLLIRRRGMMKAQGGGVGGDGQLQWIETDGVAYIDSGVHMRTPIAARILCRFMPTSTALEVLMGFGNTSNQNSSQSFIRRYASDEFRLAYHVNFASGVDGSSIVGYDMEAITQMKSGSQVLSVRKVGDLNFLTWNGTNTQGISTSPTYRIFATYESGSVYRQCQSGTRVNLIELFSDFNMNNKIANFVPWRLNGEVGLMETIGSNFLGNAAGSGAFTGGPNVI